MNLAMGHHLVVDKFHSLTIDYRVMFPINPSEASDVHQHSYRLGGLTLHKSVGQKQIIQHKLDRMNVSAWIRLCWGCKML